MLEILTGFPDDTIAIAAIGDVTEDDYRKILVPAVDRVLKNHATVRLFFHLGTDFKGFTTRAMWEDAKLGLSRWRRWDRVAIVTDVHWVAQAVKLFGAFFRNPVGIFANADYANARDWVTRREDIHRAA